MGINKKKYKRQRVKGSPQIPEERARAFESDKLKWTLSLLVSDFRTII